MDSTLSADALPLSPAMVPAGTQVWVQLDEAVGVNTPADGRFTARVISPVHGSAGEILIPAGATLEGRVTGHMPPHGGHPELIGVSFNRINNGPAGYDMSARVVEVDLALTDDDAPTRILRSAPAGLDVTWYTGMIIENPEEFFVENEVGLNPSTVISLGPDRGSTLPRGARLTLEIARDFPIHAGS